MLQAYDNGEIDRLYLVNNKFVNTMVQQPTVDQLLPLPKAEDAKMAKRHWDYLYEPDPKYLMDQLLSQASSLRSTRGHVENLASEQARMVAMKAATDNVDNLITDGQLVYNKARRQYYPGVDRNQAQRRYRAKVFIEV